MITSAFASAFADAMEHEARTLGRASTTTIGTMILAADVDGHWTGTDTTTGEQTSLTRAVAETLLLAMPSSISTIPPVTP